MRPLLSFSAFAAITIPVTLTHAAASSGCGSAVAPGLTRGGSAYTNNLNFTTTSGDIRQYALHIPTAYNVNTPAPLAFSFHGRSDTAAGQESISQMSNENWNPNFLVVYPTGINLEWQGDPDATTDDVAFTLQLVANLSSTYCVDSSRIYSAGMSNGGGFSANILACDPLASRTFAAFAGMSAACYQGTNDVDCSGDTVAISCNPGRAPVPILETHGSADGVINYYGGPRRSRCLPSIPRFMTDKGQRAGVGGMNTSTPYYNGNVIQYTYGNNASLAGVVTHYWVNGLGHTWPSTAAGTYFNATPIMFDFFNKWTLDSTPITNINVNAISSSTATSRSSTAPASTASTASAVSCPSSNGQNYTAVTGATFLIECGIDHAGGDMGSVSVKTFSDCINACANTAGCVDVSLSGVACYMKKTLGSAITNSGILGAKLVAGPQPTTSSIVTSSTVSSSPTFTTISVSSLRTTVTTSSSSTTRSAGTDGYTTTTFPPTCTAINTNIYAVTDSSGLPYLYMCGGGSAGNAVQTIQVANWTACYAACDNYTGCTGFSYNQGANLGAGAGQCLIKTAVQSFASTATLLSTRVAGLKMPVTTTSSTAVSSSR